MHIIGVPGSRYAKKRFKTAVIDSVDNVNVQSIIMLGSRQPEHMKRVFAHIGFQIMRVGLLYVADLLGCDYLP